MSKCFYCAQSEYIAAADGKPYLKCNARKWQVYACERYAQNGCDLYERNDWRQAFIDGALQDETFCSRMERLHKKPP